MHYNIMDVINECDIIIEVLDARDVDGTRSPKIEAAVRKKRKRLVFVINKIDLAQPNKCPRGAIFMSALKRHGTRKLRTVLHGMLPQQEKIRVGVVGYANTGKSSLIRAMGGGARSSAKPGFTRGTQWLRVTNRIMLLDTPGLIPRSEGETSLAIKGAYDINKIKDPVGVAMNLIDKIGREKLVNTYGVKPLDDSHEQLEELAKKWMMLLKGAKLDMNRAAKKLIRDWQTGKLK